MASPSDPLVPPDDFPPQDLLEKARNILENAPLYLDADSPDPAKGRYSVDQMLTLWEWYKSKMGQHIDNYEQVLKTPMGKEEEEELKLLEGQSRNPLAWKYKKLRDLELLQEAEKLPAEQREEFLANGYRIPTKAETAAANAATHPPAAPAPPAPVSDYSEDTEWWEGWQDPKYENMPNQRFLRGLVTALTEGREMLGEMFGSDKPVSYRPLIDAEAEPDPEAINWEEEKKKEAALWRALPPDLDPFIVRMDAEQKNALLAGPSKPPTVDLAAEWVSHRRLFFSAAASTLAVLSIRWAVRWAWRTVRQRMKAAEQAREEAEAAAAATAAKPKTRKGTGKTKKSSAAAGGSGTKSRTKAKPTS